MLSRDLIMLFLFEKAQQTCGSETLNLHQADLKR
jgi:hypothetical protein